MDFLILFIPIIIMLIPLVLLLFGFFLLIKGADFLIEGSTAIAKKLKVSNLIIGLTIVSFGTSLPELIVSVLASLNNNTDLLIGNIIGSNISNILLVLGASALFTKLSLKHGTVFKEIPFSLLAVLVMAIVANDLVINGAISSVITRSDGLILLSFFLIFLYYVYGITMDKSDVNVHTPSKYNTYTSVAYICAGIIGLYLGGVWVVDGAIFIAKLFSINQSLIGLSIVALGTSLPELVTSIVAALKKNSDLAIGNIIGSNIFNIFLVLGISAFITPIPFSIERNIDLLILTLASILLFILALFGKNPMVIDRKEGALLVSIYIAYMLYLAFTSGIFG